MVAYRVVLVVVGVGVLFAASRGSDPGAEAPAVGRPIAAVNGIIGDRSFVARFGREPTADDDELLRVGTHLAYVEGLLRARDVSGWASALRAERRRNLDRLAAYAAAGRFPAADTSVGRLPTIIDDGGRRCAVARLVEESAGTDVAVRLGLAFRKARISQIHDAGFDAWVASSGLAREELAMIQPEYSYKPEPLPANALTASIGGVYLHRLGRASGDVSGGKLGLLYTEKRIPFSPKPVLALDGILGSSGRDLAYAAGASLGLALFPDLWLEESLGVAAGVRWSALGDRAPRAITVPVSGFADIQPFDPIRLRLRGELEWVVAGASRGRAWAAGLDIVVREVFGVERTHFFPRDLILGVGYRSIGGARFLAVDLALAAHPLRYLPY
jgi:hypothetical protein